MRTRVILCKPAWRKKAHSADAGLRNQSMIERRGAPKPELHRSNVGEYRGNGAPVRIKLRTLTLLKSRYDFKRSATVVPRSQFPLLRVGGSAGLKVRGLVAGGASVHFLQELAHCIELRAEAFPISGLQSLHCLIVAIKRLPCLTCRRACGGPLLFRG